MNIDTGSVITGRAQVRLFRSEGVNTTYLGAFAFARPAALPHRRAGQERRLRSVLVFRLLPLRDVVHEVVDVAPPDVDTPEELPLEAGDVDAYVVRHTDQPPVAVRREAKLVQQYSVWLAGNGKETVRHRIPLPGGGYPFTNIFNKTTNELIEANASAARVYVRAALGQAVDYSRFLKHERRSLLLPIKPAPDLVDLLHEYAVGVIWPAGQVFDRSGLPIAE